MSGLSGMFYGEEFYFRYKNAESIIGYLNEKFN